MIPIISFTAHPMSSLEVGKQAVKILRQFQSSALLQAEPIAIEWVVEQVLSEYGFCIEIKPDDYFAIDTEAVTDFQKCIVYVRSSTYDKLDRADGRARYTLAHECGHVVLHSEQWIQKLATAARAVDITKVKPYLSPEWQANKFAAALLMPEQTFWPAYCALVRDQNRLNGFETEELAGMYEVSCKAVDRRIAALENKKGSPMM